MPLTIFTGLLAKFWWLVPIAILGAALRLPLVKGYLGELAVRLLARLLLDRSLYRRLHNVTLSTPDGTTQIDHVFVSRFGVFALETKNMQGVDFWPGERPAVDAEDLPAVVPVPKPAAAELQACQGAGGRAPGAIIIGDATVRLKARLCETAMYFGETP